MIRYLLALILAFCSCKATASGVDIREALAGSAHVLEIFIWNDVDHIDPGKLVIRQVETPYGPITLTENPTTNDQCETACPDTWTITSMPDTLWAEHMSVVVEEYSVGRIRLYLMVSA